MRTLAAFFWRWFAGAIFTLTPLTAILVVGWTQRATARAVARNWHRRAGNAANTFADFAAEDPETSRLAHWPRWIMADDAGALFAQARRSGPLRGLALGVFVVCSAPLLICEMRDSVRTGSVSSWSSVKSLPYAVPRLASKI